MSRTIIEKESERLAHDEKVMIVVDSARLPLRLYYVQDLRSK